MSSPGHAPAPTVADVLQGVRAAPSILAADYGRLSAQLAQMVDAGARLIHLDGRLSRRSCCRA